MSALNLQVSVNRREDIPQIVSQHLEVLGEAKIGGSLAAMAHLTIFPDNAKIFIEIEKYSNMPSEMQEKMDYYFANVSGLNQGDPMFVAMPGPVYYPEHMTQENFDALVKKNSGSVTYPLVRSVTWVNSLKTPDSPQTQALMSHIKTLVEAYFPNKKEETSDDLEVQKPLLESGKSPVITRCNKDGHLSEEAE